MAIAALRCKAKRLPTNSSERRTSTDAAHDTHTGTTTPHCRPSTDKQRLRAPQSHTKKTARATMRVQSDEKNNNDASGSRAGAADEPDIDSLEASYAES